MEAVALSEPVKPQLKVARPNPFYRPELDAVRLLAFLLVFVHHNMNNEASQYGASLKAQIGLTIARISGFGLPLFFVLSAFLISDLLMREKTRFGKVDIPAFYKRRALRIWPLYLLGLAIGWAVGAFTGHPETWRFVSFLFILGNWSVVRYGWFDNPMVILWSISVEEQFYLLWPVVARRFSRRGMFGVCAGLIVLANAFLLYFGLVHSDLDGVVWCNTFVQFEMFAAGILLALGLRQGFPKLTDWMRLSLFGLGFASWYVSAQVCKSIMGAQAVSPTILIPGYGLMAVGCVLILGAVLGIESTRVPKWVAYLGRISFGLYVFHELAMGIAVWLFHDSHRTALLLATKVVALGLTVLFASLSYKFFETPFLRLKGRLARIETRPI